MVPLKTLVLQQRRKHSKFCKRLNLTSENERKMIFDHKKIGQKERQAGQQRNGMCGIGLSNFSPVYLTLLSRKGKHYISVPWGTVCLINILEDKCSA